MNDLTTRIKSLYAKAFARVPAYDRKSLRPSRDWMAIFVGTLVLILLCALGAYYFYTIVDAGEFFTVNKETIESEAKINLNLLKKTVDDINSREARLSAAEKGNIAPPDPSK